MELKEHRISTTCPALTKSSKEQTKFVSAAELSKHNTETDLWITVNSNVWNITEFAPTHPGGMASMLHF